MRRPIPGKAKLDQEEKRKSEKDCIESMPHGETPLSLR